MPKDNATNKENTPMEHALANLERKIFTQIESETLDRGAGHDSLQKRINALILAFLGSHKIAYNPATNHEHPERIASIVLDLCYELRNHVSRIEQQRLIEGLGEQIMKDHFKG